MSESNRHLTRRDLSIFGALLIAFFAALGGLVLWKPGALLFAAAVLAVAALVSVAFNRTRPALAQLTGLLLPVLFGAIGGAERLGVGAWVVAMVVWAVGALAGLVVLLAPPLGRRVYAEWTRAAEPIGWTISHVVLALLYYTVLTPVGLLMRLFGYDPLCRRLDRAAESYWFAHTPGGEPKRYFRQF